MKYQMIMRELNESDLSSKCPYPPETDEYERYLDALVEDINEFPIVSNATRINNKVSIETTDCSYKDLLEAIKPLISGERDCQYRVVTLNPAK